MAAMSTEWRGLTARILAASVGAYGFCYAWIAALAMLLPRITKIDSVDATIIATSVAFLAFVVIILRGFSIRSPLRLWIEITVGTVLPVALIALFR